jgi:hypothetical protein
MRGTGYTNLTAVEFALLVAQETGDYLVHS